MSPAAHPGARTTCSSSSATTGTCVPRTPPSGSCRRGRTVARCARAGSSRPETSTMRSASASRRARDHSGALAATRGTRPHASEPPLPARLHRHPGRGGRDGARGHEVRPQGEAGEEPEQEQRAAGRRPAFLAEAAPRLRGQQEDEPAEHECRGVEGRRQRGQEQEVRRGARDQHRRRERRPRVELPRERVGERHQQQREEEHGQAQRLRAVAEGRDEGQGHPRVERRAVGLAPEGGPDPRVPRHEAHDRGVAVHRGVERLDPERQANHDREKERERDRARGPQCPSCGVSPGGAPSASPSTPAPANHGGGQGRVAQVTRLGPTDSARTSAVTTAAKPSRLSTAARGRARRATQPCAATRKTAGIAGRR